MTLLLATVAGCWQTKDEAPSVVVYTAEDSDYAAPTFAEFKQREAIVVSSKTDTESTKTVGLANAIIAEAARPRCDLFWNNEILLTLRLEQKGLIEAYSPAASADFEKRWQSPTGHWHGFAARARILLVNRDAMKKELAAGGKPPSTLEDLTDPHWRDRVGMAKPLFGTTATHATCLFAKLGSERARDFFTRLKGNNVHILAGNRQVAREVASGQLAFGLTDTDDAMEEVDAGSPVEIDFPDQSPDSLGTLLIPNTLAIIKNGPHPAAARKLLDFLLSPGVEQTLAAGPSAQIPLGSKCPAKPRIAGWRDDLHWMDVDFSAAAERWDEAAKFLREQFSQ